ncbi:hypothetical protein PF005_g9290 [Phytophthora fragariae]|uniref:Uncharacterized protein n=1 Tax=Phytophthora fragariae TaxID=53985 RepID=A0A6A3YBK8_9STRA|nr:hypothetical protein PF003_g31878 [Phytophthora fragariae]KAE8939381.1 hypothetical protein PF009_g10775 [Phytophthora fragariae]KAE9020586.1 hypothetical protein PF011_g5340 [Phytophthora fragariae]KAE9116889.1 hypothetical protein PF010_g8798 [Phytophthora fragariae]KAE9125476.1 hypothetical protein PF007_g6334 [Phytophthora fragariae]
MESLYARDTPTAHERKLKLAERDLKGDERSSHEQPTLESLVDGSTVANAATESTTISDSTTNPADDTFGFGFSDDTQQQWRTQGVEAEKTQQNNQSEDTKTVDEASGSGDSTSASSNTEKLEPKTAETTAPTLPPSTCAPDQPTQQPRRAGVASVPRKPKPAITINTGSGSGTSGVGAKRPPPTPVSPPTLSWNDILRVQNLIERCLQQYLSKNDILLTLKEQANVDPAFANVVWQKLEEQNPTFFRAYSLQLQLKEQIIAFNYLVGQQKEMAAKGGKRLLHYSNMSRPSAGRSTAPCSLMTNVTPTTTTLPPISMDARTFLRTPIRSAKQQRTPAGKRAYNQHQHMNIYQSVGVSSLPPPSPLPLPSPIKTDLDTHAFFT